MVPREEEIQAEPGERRGSLRGDPTLGIRVPVAGVGTPRHRLVAIGDSFTQNFQSGAVYNNQFSFPAFMAHALGTLGDFRYPVYGGPGGLPLNMEWLLRTLEGRFGDRITRLDGLAAVSEARRFMKQVEDYWERGPGSRVDEAGPIYHNLASYGLDIHDLTHVTAETLRARIRPPRSNLISLLPEYAWERAALVVLASATTNDVALTVVDAAKALGSDGTKEDGQGDGIETLLVWVGVDSTISPITSLEIRWSNELPSDDDDDLRPTWTIWRPDYFLAELANLGREIGRVRARQVLWATIPRPSLLPIVHGVGPRSGADQYHAYYTRPWISASRFDPVKHPHLTGDEVREIDLAVDDYNRGIVDLVRSSRRDGKDWRLVEVGLLFRLLAEKTRNGPESLAEVLPPALAHLEPVPDTRWFMADSDGRVQGGLVSLDGVHPTTIGYALVAQEFLAAMQAGESEREDDCTFSVDFERAVKSDTLNSRPPLLTKAFIRVLARLDRTKVVRDWRRLISRSARLGARRAVRLTWPTLLILVLIAFVLDHLSLLIQGLVLVVAVLALATRLSRISLGVRRERFFDWLVERQGTAAPIMYALNTLAIAVLVFSVLTVVLHDSGVARLRADQGQPIQAHDVGLFYAWHVTEAVPFAEVNNTIRWKRPFDYQSRIVAAQILLFQVLIIVPIVVAVSEGWKNRAGRNERYRRREAESFARELGLD